MARISSRTPEKVCSWRCCLQPPHGPHRVAGPRDVEQSTGRKSKGQGAEKAGHAPAPLPRSLGLVPATGPLPPLFSQMPRGDHTWVSSLSDIFVFMELSPWLVMAHGAVEGHRDQSLILQIWKLFVQVHAHRVLYVREGQPKSLGF